MPLNWGCDDFRRVMLSAALCALVVGCGPGGPGVPPLVKVSGTITMDGKPLADAMVNFTPDTGRPSAGKTDAQGKYSLMYNEKTEGAVVGKHKVQIVKIPSGAPTKENNAQMLIPIRYNFQTQLEADIKSGENKDVNFELTSN